MSDHETLFPRLSQQNEQNLRLLELAIAEVRPLKKEHKRSLPADIKALSLLLTQERASLGQPYWREAGFISAYLYYFLPWNILRCLRFLGGIGQRFAGIDSVLDLGSGPLTFPIALWLSFPELRIKPLRVVVQDKSGQPLEFGQRLLEALCRQQKQPLVWEIKRLVGNMSIVHSQLMRQKFSLISAVNVFNEFCVQKKNVRQQERENWGGMGEVLEQIQLLLSDQGYFLSIEPGTRWGGKIMMQLRAMALSMGLHIELPCTHEQKCPLMHRSWCHTTFEANGAPSWLRALSAAAGLEKETLSLACLLVRRGQKKQSKKCFVLSEPFSVPNLSGMARYACSGKGLLLLEDAASLAQGTRFVVEVPGHASIDKKSSALIVKRR